MTVEVNLLALLHKAQLTAGSKPEQGDDMRQHKVVLDKFTVLTKKPDARYAQDAPLTFGAIPTAPVSKGQP